MVSCATGWPSHESVAENNPEFLILLPSLLSAGIVGMHQQAWFIRCWGPNPGLCVYKASTLPIELHFQLEANIALRNHRQCVLNFGQR